MIDLIEKRVLVTGAHGFLGSHITARLKTLGCRNIIAPRHAECDLTRCEAVEALFRNHRPEIIIHAAAAVGGIGANQANPGRFFYENAIMGLQLIEAARCHGTEKVVVLGTICAYPKITPIPFREDDIWNGFPETVTAPYGLAKKLLMVQCQAYRQQYGMNAITLLPGNLYGPRDHFGLETSHVAPAIIRKCAEARDCGEAEVVLWGDGSATREFLYAEDAATGIVLATQSYDKPEPVNLGSGNEISIRELAEMIAALVGFKGRIIWDTKQPSGQPRRCLDVSRAEHEFGFSASMPLKEGMRRTIEWYLANCSGDSALSGRARS
jgi:GDP-L-fucose synthase